mmetsp:Transcript_2995/g.12285  ORF Transcript_2995/g.12285 Transcript_2995/m.12285 type:complete len:282 (-) Transcript_2995:312-1157(-)
MNRRALPRNAGGIILSRSPTASTSSGMTARLGTGLGEPVGDLTGRGDELRVLASASLDDSRVVAVRACRTLVAWEWSERADALVSTLKACGAPVPSPRCCFSSPASSSWLSCPSDSLSSRCTSSTRSCSCASAPLTLPTMNCRAIALRSFSGSLRIEPRLPRARRPAVGATGPVADLASFTPAADVVPCPRSTPEDDDTSDVPEALRSARNAPPAASFPAPVVLLATRGECDMLLEAIGPPGLPGERSAHAREPVVLAPSSLTEPMARLASIRSCLVGGGL